MTELQEDERGRWDRMTPVQQYDYVVGLEGRLARAREREAKWLQAFNSLEKPVTRHIERCIDAADLIRAHRVVMRKFGPGGGS